ncbi:hypothetical protein Z946_3506 [Sulfitobacter noctilucicola]|uniref:DUF4177 domain-containing protein n=1 Tax=Sulfitobacter noctilucicola TaxID=1342301 RepID=A0A7W6Q5X8_9RHOB|nr:hypothetical protein [Sulfitobacter noctilucicola]KIN64614.1 hypothetical protein Z946_3506 [Sulfitobacter noctilucicola]MBB4174235.1 hypothetical protein [Sulfitobacter noctilucicola]
MPRYEYKVVPAPTKGLKAKGVKGAEARFAHAVQELMNGLAGYGWEYQRAETLPSIERSGLTSSTTEWRNVLVFRRLREHDAEAFAPELLPPPPSADDNPDQNDVGTPAKADTADAETAARSGKNTDEKSEIKPEVIADDIDGAFDNGVEDTDNLADTSSTLKALAASRNPSKSET